MELLNAYKIQLTEAYLYQWVKTLGAHLSVDFAWGTELGPFRRMRIICTKCNQTLTGDIPETPEKIDWAMQKFAGLHRHEPKVELVHIPKGEPIIKVQLAPIPLTVDFKPSRARVHKEGRKFRETN